MQLDDITKVEHGESIKAKYAKRKGFSKAQDEMNWYINRTRHINKGNIDQNQNTTSVGLRRSARIAESQGATKSTGGLRWSVRIAKLREKTVHRYH